jgi:F420-non-reducing hydrogenase iron-sulfur subunit
MTIKRITFLQELLVFMGLEGRLHLEWISSAEAQKFVQVITDFTEKIRTLGPNRLPVYASAALEFGSNSKFIKKAFLPNVVD